MVSLSRLATVLVTIAALAWFLPDLFRRATQPERVRVSAYYSAPAGQFLTRTDTFDKSEYRDESGRIQTVEQHRRLLPFLYFADLAKHGQFPAEVGGKAVTPEAARRDMQVLQLNPRDWNTAQLNIHTLFESSPWSARLALPEDMFRVEPAGLTFIRTADGTIDTDKSKRFTKAMHEAGVLWPLRGIGGNPSPLKEFDEGYLLVDAASTVFQLKMVHGEPDCRNTRLSIPGHVRAVAVDEHARREFYGAVVTDESVFLVTYADTLLHLPLDGFHADNSMAVLRTDPLNRTIASADMRDRIKNPLRLVAMGTDYQPVRRFDLPLPDGHRSYAVQMQTLASALFPFSIIQSVPEDGRVLLRLAPAASLPLAAAGCALATIILVILRRRSGQRVMPVDVVVTLLTGLPGLIALQVFGPVATTDP